MKNIAPITNIKRTGVKLRDKTGVTAVGGGMRHRGLIPLLSTRLGRKLTVEAPKASVKSSKKVILAEEPEDPRPLIQWPGDALLREASKQLLIIKNAGVAYESGGDHFNSGDLAYQLQEILKNIHELHRKTQRIKELKNA